MATRVVCISHAIGAQGDVVARLAAERLGLRLVDEEIVTAAAARGGIEPSLVAGVERRRSLAARLTEVLEIAGAAEAGAADPSHMDIVTSDGMRALIRDVIREVADEGDVVIMSHAASMALAGRPGVLRVLVTASARVRAERLREARGLDRRAAERAVKDSDAARAQYFQRFYGVDRELPTHYDLVLSTDVLGPEQAAELVVRAAPLVP